MGQTKGGDSPKLHSSGGPGGVQRWSVLRVVEGPGLRLGENGVRAWIGASECSAVRLKEGQGAAHGLLALLLHRRADLLPEGLLVAG